MPLIASMINGAVSDTVEHLQTLSEARARPHVLDAATLEWVKCVHDDQLAFVEIYAEQLRCWRTARPSPAQLRELDRLEAQNRRLHQLTADVLALAQELRQGSIERVMAMSDLQLGPHALLRALSAGRS